MIYRAVFHIDLDDPKVFALGLANIGSSLFGGIAGCGMIGQAVGNVTYGGRGRLSTAFAGIFLLVLMVLLKPWVAQVPVVALVAIMLVVAVVTFDWSSLRALLHQPRLSSLVMLATVVVTLATHNLAAGVGIGVLLSGVFFAIKVSRVLEVHHEAGSDSHQVQVAGQVFFANADAFIEAFDPQQMAAEQVLIDLGQARLWDITAVGALDTVVKRLRQHGKQVRVVGMDAGSRNLMRRVLRGEVPL